MSPCWCAVPRPARPPGRSCWRSAPAGPTDRPWARSSSSPGMSGAGRTTCLKMLEDLGFEAVDNLPVNLLGARPARRRRPARSASPSASTAAPGASRRTACSRRSSQARASGRTCLLFLECDDEVLRRRFTETRRRHPLADLPGVGDALAAERELMAPLKARGRPADRHLATCRCPTCVGCSPGGSAPRASASPITVMSFAYRNGLPREADLVFDVRFLRNPALCRRAAPGDRPGSRGPGVHPRRPGVRAVRRRPADGCWLPLLPRYRGEGKSYLTIAFGCTGGRHRSVFLAELTARWLQRLRLGGDHRAP